MVFIKKFTVLYISCFIITQALATDIKNNSVKTNGSEETKNLGTCVKCREEKNKIWNVIEHELRKSKKSIDIIIQELENTFSSCKRQNLSHGDAIRKIIKKLSPKIQALLTDVSNSSGKLENQKITLIREIENFINNSSSNISSNIKSIEKDIQELREKNNQTCNTLTTCLKKQSNVLKTIKISNIQQCKQNKELQISVEKVENLTQLRVELDQTVPFCLRKNHKNSKLFKCCISDMLKRFQSVLKNLKQTVQEVFKTAESKSMNCISETSKEVKESLLSVRTGITKCKK